MLILARHGQSEANASGLLVGRADSDLTDLGRRQAEAIGAAIAAESRAHGRPILRLISSPLARAAETADAIAAALEPRGDAASLVVEIDSRVIELDYGALDLVRASAVDPSTWRTWRSDPAFCPPGGESLEELAGRIDPVLDELLPLCAGPDATADVVIVSHVSPIKAAIARALGVGVEVSWRMSLSVASISRIGAGPGGAPMLVSFNETGHLAGV